MGLLKNLGDFLFGKDPDIFDEKGQVVHRHPKKKWDAWANRYRNESQYNWRRHSGMTGPMPIKDSSDKPSTPAR